MSWGTFLFGSLIDSTEAEGLNRIISNLIVKSLNPKVKLQYDQLNLVLATCNGLFKDTVIIFTYKIITSHFYLCISVPGHQYISIQDNECYFSQLILNS